MPKEKDETPARVVAYRNDSFRLAKPLRNGRKINVKTKARIHMATVCTIPWP